MIPIRHIATLLLLLFAIQAIGKRDSLLWVGIKQTGTIYQEGLRDSALTKAQHLLAVAEDKNDALAQAQLHSLIGFCLREKGNHQAAAEEFQRCIAIGEANDFIVKNAKSSHHLYTTVMLPAYSLLSVYYKDNHQIKKAADHARKGMEWMRFCQDPETWVSSICAFSEVLMVNKEYDLIYEPLKQGVTDALRHKQTDFALMMISHLIYIEYNVMHRNPKDIPWIKAGEMLLPDVKTETAKTTFLAATKLTLPQPESEDSANHGGNSFDSAHQEHEPAPMAAKPDSIRTRIEYVRLRNERIGIIGGILALTILLFVLYILWQQHQRRKTAQKAEQRMEERFIEGQEDERTRLAKELHDGISNQLLAVEMKLNEEGLTPQTMQLLSMSREQVRQVSHKLIPPDFEHATLDEVIRNYTDSLDGLHQCEVTYRQTPPDTDWTEIPPAKALEIYRIIQEAVSNSLKHANATSLSIGVHLDDENLKVLISDNGTWKKTKENSTGIGTRTISQRASAINGKIEIFHHQFGSTLQLIVNRKSLQNNV